MISKSILHSDLLEPRLRLNSQTRQKVNLQTLWVNFLQIKNLFQSTFLQI